MVIKKFESEIRSASNLVRLIMLYGDVNLLKKWENGHFGYYLVRRDSTVVRITEKEYEFAYKAYYQERN